MENIIPLLQSAASTIDNTVTHNTNHLKSKNQDNTLYIHWKYHPTGINNQTLRNIQ
jgi:hypothetical protein